MIVLEANEPNLTRVTIGEIPSPLLKKCFPDACNDSPSFCVKENIWDCVGDLLLCTAINGEGDNCSIVLQGGPYYESRYYSAESLVSLYLDGRERGWTITMENKIDFYLKCPEFDAISSELALSSNQTMLCVEKKNYAHPVDSTIIDVLDMPGVRTVFGSAVDMLTDLSYSQIISTGIPVDRENFPEIDDIVNQCVAVLGIKKPYVVISNAVALSAFTVGSDEEPYIVLGNMLVRVMDPANLTFVIGHECGHIAMEHVIYHTVVSTAGAFSQTIPFIGPLVYNSSAVALKAWSRRSEITADRAGLLCCLDVDVAQKALLQLESGFISANQLDLNSYVQNSKRYRRNSVLRRVSEFLAAHPPLSKRIEALDLFAQSSLYYTAQGLEVPANCISEQELAMAVEHLIAVLGEE